ncbi:hypothetical protein MMC13_000121 [Lambiella insularis]|nr:hypothetical protein [Lambiella insularis]
MVVEVELPINGTPGSRLVSDPPGDKTVVAFAVWRRLGSSPEVDYWRKFRAPSIDKKEEKAIFDSFKYLQSIPQPDAISSLQRETVMIGAENCAAAQYFSNRLAECWFLLEMYSHPRYGPSAHILLKWGLEMAGQENACVSTFQPKARCDFFFSYGFWPIGEVQIFCQDLIPKQGGEAGEVLDATFGAGGIRRVILRATQYSRANPFWSGASHNWRNADEKYKRNFYKTLLRLEERSARPEA